MSDGYIALFLQPVVCSSFSKSVILGLTMKIHLRNRSCLLLNGQFS